MTRERSARLPQVLFEIGKAIGSEDGLEPLLGHISKLITELLEADACSVMLLGPSGNELYTKAAYGISEGRVGKVSFRVGQGVAGSVVESGEPAVIDDVSKDHRFVFFENSTTKIGSMVCVPLVARAEPVGALTATSEACNAFTDDDVELLEFVAKTIALDVENIRLRKMSVTDPLTGAFNREFLQQRLPVELALAAQRKTPLSVAMIDVDFFKSVNDRFGHGAGDLVLAEIASRIRSAIRQNDVLVRYGGEEFLVMLPQANAERATDVAERVRRQVAQSPIDVDKTPIEVRISAGVAECRPNETTVDLINRADAALYSAKQAGRNRVEVVQ